EHGERTHGTFLYDATIHVPLLVKLPDMAASRVVTVPVETADLAPTIAAMAGAVIGAVDGENLLALFHPGLHPNAAAALGTPGLTARDTRAGDPDRPAYA